jgi:hypothetical protein
MPIFSDLKFYGSSQTSLKIYIEVVKYSYRMKRRLSKGQIAEIEFVQEETETFLNKLKLNMRHNNSCKFKREKPYNFTIENEADIVNVAGVTDHVLGINESSFVALTVEDKKMNKQLTESDITQAKSQMVSELMIFSEAKDFSPPSYCGILQNGSNWVFLRREISDRGKELWTYYACKSVLITKNDILAVDLECCKLIARYIENALFVADNIIDSVIEVGRDLFIRKDVKRGTYKSDDDDEDDTKTNNNFSYLPKSMKSLSLNALNVTQGNSNVKTTSGNKSTKSSRISKNANSISAALCNASKENCRPLTLANMSRQPHSQIISSFLYSSSN